MKPDGFVGIRYLDAGKTIKPGTNPWPFDVVFLDDLHL